jgi:hypothetical protein
MDVTHECSAWIQEGEGLLGLAYDSDGEIRISLNHMTEISSMTVDDLDTLISLANELKESISQKPRC